MEENNFEKSMENLENIVTELEKGELNLDESVKKLLKDGNARSYKVCY